MESKTKSQLSMHKLCLQKSPNNSATAAFLSVIIDPFVVATSLRRDSLHRQHKHLPGTVPTMVLGHWDQDATRLVRNACEGKNGETPDVRR